MPQALDGGAAFFRFEPALARTRGRLGGPARSRRYRSASDQVDEAVARVLTVAFLGAMALRVDPQHALAREPAARQPLEAQAHRIGQVERAAHVEAQLHRARELVDVLPAGARRSNEAFIELALVDGDAVGDADHRHAIAWPRGRWLAPRSARGRDAFDEDEGARQRVGAHLGRPRVFGRAVPGVSAVDGGKFHDDELSGWIPLPFDQFDRPAAHDVAPAILLDARLRQGAIAVDPAVVENFDFRDHIGSHGRGPDEDDRARGAALARLRTRRGL